MEKIVLLGELLAVTLIFNFTATTEAFPIISAYSATLNDVVASPQDEPSLPADVPGNRFLLYCPYLVQGLVK